MMILLGETTPLPPGDQQAAFDLIAIRRGNKIQVVKNRAGPPLGVMSMDDFDLVVRKYLRWLVIQPLDESLVPR